MAFQNIILELAQDQKVHGLLVQLPLPKHLHKIDLKELIPAEKDVDGFHYLNLGKLIASNTSDSFIPCTPKGILQLLNYNHISLEGKHAVIIGRSLIVGKPLSVLLTNHNATVTLCHSYTQNLERLTKEADIIFVAIGIPNFLGKTYLSNTKKQIIIDIGINTRPDKKLCGDVNFNEIQNLVEAITPVPGGIGPLTILSLTQNLLLAAERSTLSCGKS